MDRSRNPYVPGAGRQPHELVGRDALIAGATADMNRVLLGRSPKDLMMLGLRGVGKTVLLNHLLNIATNMGFLTIKIEAPENGRLPELLAPQLRQILYKLDMKTGAGHLIKQAFSIFRNFAASFKIAVGELEIGMEPSPGQSDTGDLQQDLPTLLVAVAQAAAEKKTAIALFIDEVQYLSTSELAAVVVSCHEIAQRNLPFYFVGAGLPQVAALAGNAKSYAERLFDYPEIGPLDRTAARTALVGPAEFEGVRFEPSAVEAILDVTEGYPFFIQTWGSFVWDSADHSPISADTLQAVTPAIMAHLDSNFFRVRFDRLSTLQQKYLRAMAELGPGSHNTGDIAVILGVTPSAIATVRQALIDKGMVWSQRYGETAFTVPLFDVFMKRQIPVLEKHIPKSRALKQ